MPGEKHTRHTEWAKRIASGVIDSNKWLLIAREAVVDTGRVGVDVRNALMKENYLVVARWGGAKP